MKTSGDKCTWTWTVCGLKICAPTDPVVRKEQGATPNMATPDQSGCCIESIANVIGSRILTFQKAKTLKAGYAKRSQQT